MLAKDPYTKFRENVLGWSAGLLGLSLMVSCNGSHMELAPAGTSGVKAQGASGAGGPTYNGEIRQLFSAKCAYCHNATSSLPNWLDYSTAFRLRDEIYRKVVVEKSMPMPPYDTQMSAADRQLVADWINDGAPEGGPDGGSPSPAASTPPSPGHSPEPIASATTEAAPPPAAQSPSSGPETPFPGPCHELTTPALANAASAGDSDEVTRLLDDGVCADSAASGALPPLMALLVHPGGGGCDAFPTIVHELALFKANVNAVSDGGSALIWASARDYAEVARILVENGAEVNTQVQSPPASYLKNWVGFTPLMFAVQDGDYPLAQAFLEHGARVDTALPDGRTALSIAQALQNPDQRNAFVTLLKKHQDGAPPAPPSGGATGPTYTYSRDILPIIKNRCAICHNDSTPGMDWLKYTDAFAKRQLIFQHVVVQKDMPLGNATQMTDAERSEFGDWIQEGAPQ